MAEPKIEVPAAYRVNDLSVRGSDGLITFGVQMDDGKATVNVTAPSAGIDLKGATTINGAMRNAIKLQLQRAIAVLDAETAKETA